MLIDDLACLGVGLFDMNINILVSGSAAITVRHLEIDALCLFLAAFSNGSRYAFLSGYNAFVRYGQSGSRYGEHRSNKSKS
jgi:hypothetical protein